MKKFNIPDDFDEMTQSLLLAISKVLDLRTHTLPAAAKMLDISVAQLNHVVNGRIGDVQLATVVSLYHQAAMPFTIAHVVEGEPRAKE